MGSGSHSSRSMRLGGLLLGRAAAEIVEQGKKIAARALQADAAPSSSRTAVSTWPAPSAPSACSRSRDSPASSANRAGAGSVGRDHHDAADIPERLSRCEVEIDPDTGAVTIERYVAVDDVGRVVNPLLVDGQTHGSTVQGLGQALMENCVYDRDGQLLSGSFMDYAMPRADMLPSFEVETNEVPAPNNPLGVKGAGEGGSTGAPPAIVNAIVDALREFGVRDVPMPATSERVWRAIQQGRIDVSDFVRCEQAGGVTTITLNRPECGNLVSNQMGGEIAGMIAAAADSRLIVLRGAGDDFCLGRDSAALRAAGPFKTAIDMRRGNTEPALAVYGAFRRTTVPVLGIVQGRAIGFGCALAGLCDVTIASDDATFQLPEMDHGIPPCLAMSALLGNVTPKGIMYLVYSTETSTRSARSGWGW